MEVFEEMAIDGAERKTSLWGTYIDDTFVTWKHSVEDLQIFLCRHNILRRTNKFTQEAEAHFGLYSY
jgi:hypothetical protein